MCILASALEDYVHSCVGFGRLFWTNCGGEEMHARGGGNMPRPAPPRAWKNKNESISKNAYVYFTPENKNESISKNTFDLLPPISFFLLFFFSFETTFSNLLLRI